MGFFGLQQKTDTLLPKGLTLEFLHKHGCQVCPLYKCPGNHHPDMKPTGAKNPVVYMLGEAPGENEDEKGEQFIGKAGRVLRSRIPDDWFKYLRWNNVVRTRPPKNREPSQVEIEACRPSIIRDIEESKPRAIFGFGGVPLHWVLKETGITRWHGKKVPVKIGNHTCWFYPMLHPSYVMRKSNASRYGSADEEFVFTLDLRQAFDEIAELPPAIVHTREDALAGVEILETVDQIRDALKGMWEQPLVGIDYETSSLRPYQEDAVILSAALSNGGSTVAFALGHREAKWTDEELQQIESLFRKFLRKAPCKKIAYNLAFEMEWSGTRFGKECLWGGRWGDAQLQAYILDPQRCDPSKGILSLEAIALQHFGINIKEEFKVNRKKMADEPLSKMLPYNGVDAKYCLLAYKEQREELKRLGLQKVYTRQLKRIPTMVLTQIKGVPVDHDVVAEFAARYTKRVNRRVAELMALPCVRKFKKLEGKEFNPGSNPNVKTLVTKVLGVKLDGGVDETVLRTIKDPFGPALLKWRKATKLYSTYVLSAEPGRIWPDGLLHPLTHTMRVVTSRTSSSSPNIQNWPKRGPGKVVRKQIRPGPEEVVVAIDFAGIQARNVAMESNDEKLVKAFWNHYDIHGDFTERLARIYPSFFGEGGKAVAKDKELFKGYRNRVKNEFVFPSFFGASPKSVAKYLGVPIHIGEKLQEQFWGDFEDVPIWHKELRKHYQEFGWIMGLSGFRHTAPIAHTEIINYPIQADEAIIVCEAQGNLSKRGEEFQANLMVHDDLTFVMRKREVDKILPVILDEMLKINFDWINVPLACEVSIGPDWYDLSRQGEYESMIGGGYKQL